MDEVQRKALGARVIICLLLVFLIYYFVDIFYNLSWKVLVYFSPIILFGLYAIYRWSKILVKYNKESDEEVARDFSNLRSKNLEYQADIPSNLISYLFYNKNKVNSTQFLEFGNSYVRIISFLFFAVFFFVVFYRSGNLEYFVFMLIGVFILGSIVLFMAKNTAQAQLKFEKKLEKDKKEGKKPGLLDEFNLKSFSLVILLGILIAGGIFLLFGLILIIFA